VARTAGSWTGSPHPDSTKLADMDPPIAENT
jgi:hypothetical protein